MPRVAPKSLSKARDWKKDAFLPVVFSAAVKLEGNNEISVLLCWERRAYSDWSVKPVGSSSEGLASSNAIRSASDRTPLGFSNRASK